MKSSEDDNLQEQKRQLEYLRARVNAAKIAYLNRTPFGSMTEVSYGDLKSIAQEFIRASNNYQKLKYGSVQVRLSIAKLLRH